MMKDVSPEWWDVLMWAAREFAVPNPPTCPPISIRGWLAKTTPADEAAAEAALMEWLCSWQWPEMTPAVSGLVHLRLSFAMFGMIQALAQGRPPLRGDAQLRGTIRGLVFREWDRQREAWIEAYPHEWPGSFRALAGN